MDSMRTILKLCKISEEPNEDENMVGKVVNQTPIRDTSILGGGAVDITIAIKKTG